MSCLDEKTASALAAGLIPSTEAEALHRHAEGCGTCSALLARVMAATSPVRSGPPADALVSTQSLLAPVTLATPPPRPPAVMAPPPAPLPPATRVVPPPAPPASTLALLGSRAPTALGSLSPGGHLSNAQAPGASLSHQTVPSAPPLPAPLKAPSPPAAPAMRAAPSSVPPAPQAQSSAPDTSPAPGAQLVPQLAQPPGASERETRAERATPRALPPSTAPSGTGPEARMRREQLAYEPGAHASVGRYQLLDKLGAGGMGVVYSAHDPELNRRVAIKLLHPQADPEVQADGATRLLREAQAMARLSHPNVVSVYDAGTFAGRVFIAMELVEGLSLRHWLRAAHRSWREVLELFRQSGRGLAAAHAAGLVHRDFKPANVLVNKDGRAQVTDFGLARNTPDQNAAEPSAPGMGPRVWNDLLESPLTEAGIVMGTPAYMPPEQHEARDTDARGDQFSFCASLYEALYGQLPFSGKRTADYLAEIVAGHVRPPPRDSRVPSWLLRVITRGLAPAPEARYPSMEALLDALGKDPAVAWRRRGAVAAGVVLLSGAVGVTSWVNQRQQALCSGAEARLAGIWDGALKSRLQQAFTATGSPLASTVFTRVAAELDGYARAWTGMHREACEATRIHGHQSDEALSLRMACLDRRRSSLEALTQVLLQTDAKTLASAQEAAQYLPPVSACADVEALRRGLPESPEQRQRVEALRSRVDRVTALVDAGRYPQAREELDTVLEQARASGYGPVLAEALELEGRLELARDDEERARPSLQEAFLTAYAHQHDVLAARAAARLVTTLHPEPPLESWTEAQARAAIGRLGGAPEPAALLETSLGRNAFLRGDYTQAAQAFERAAALRTKSLGADHLLTLEAWRNQAAALSRTPDSEQAASLLRHVLEATERVMGPDHPQTAYAANAMGVHLLAQRQAEEAATYLRRAVAVEEQSHGPDSATLSYPLQNLAAALEALDRHAEARPLRERALALDLKTYGPDHPETARDLALLSGLALREGQPRDALDFARRSVSAYEASRKDHPDLAMPLMALGQAWLALGKPRQAVAPLERALALRLAHPGPAEPLAATRFALARALPSRSAAKARVLATQALEFYDSKPDTFSEEATRIRAWLKGRGGRR